MGPYRFASGRNGRPPNSQIEERDASTMATPLPRIAVIGTGGTISSLGASSLDVLDYPDFGEKLTCEALLDRFPETQLVADPMPVTFRQVPAPRLARRTGSRSGR